MVKFKKIESRKEEIIEETPTVIGIVEILLDAKDKMVTDGYTIYKL